jgi:hypothetical protein
MIKEQMIKCNGCGFNVEQEDVVELTEYHDSTCEMCVKCQVNPLLRECYRRGFNAGLDALSQAVQSIVIQSNLRKR